MAKRRGITFTVEGGEELLRKLRAMGKNIGDELEAAATSGADVILAAADARAPGPHIEMDVVEKGNKRVSVDIGPDDDHWYYRFVETGIGPHEIAGSPLLVFKGQAGLVFARGVKHPGMAAQPFLRPAFDTRHQAAEKAVAAHLKKVAERGT